MYNRNDTYIKPEYPDIRRIFSKDGELHDGDETPVFAAAVGEKQKKGSLCGQRRGIDMDLQQLRNVVEVAACGSISKAAKKLYMGQPNLSKSIKELENEIGKPLFARTAQGVAPTASGEDFLRYARSILEQMDSLTALYLPHGEDTLRLSVYVPRASYIAAAFSNWEREHASGAFQLQYRETNSMTILQAVEKGDADVGIVRYHRQHQDYFRSLIVSKGLHGDSLWEYSMVLLLHESHPLAHLREIPYHQLAQYPEIVHGDLTPVLPPEALPDETMPEPSRQAGRIAVYDRAGQFDALRNIAGPMPQETLDCHRLVQRPCQSAGLYRDAVIWKGKMTAAASSFIEAVHTEINALVQTR